MVGSTLNCDDRVPVGRSSGERSLDPIVHRPDTGAQADQRSTREEGRSEPRRSTDKYYCQYYRCCRLAAARRVKKSGLRGGWKDGQQRRGFAQFFVENGSTDHESGDARADDERKTRHAARRDAARLERGGVGRLERRESEQTEERTGRGEQPESERSMTLPVAVYVTLTVTVILVYTTRTRPSRGAERSKWRVV